MRWHYEIVDEDTHFALVYRYHDILEDGDTATSEPIIVGESKEDIHSQLKQMLADTV